MRVIKKFVFYDVALDEDTYYLSYEDGSVVEVDKFEFDKF